MKLRIHLSGGNLYFGELDFVPPLGTVVRFEIQGYCKGHHAGSIFELTVNANDPPAIDFTEKEPVIILNANGFTVVQDAPVPPDQDY